MTSKEALLKLVQDNGIIIANDLPVILNDLDRLEELEKALEIIVKKGVAVGMLQLKEVGVKEYNDFIGDTKLYLTQEEYDFLKEYLK